MYLLWGWGKGYVNKEQKCSKNEFWKNEFNKRGRLPYAAPVCAKGGSVLGPSH